MWHAIADVSKRFYEIFSLKPWAWSSEIFFVVVVKILVKEIVIEKYLFKPI